MSKYHRVDSEAGDKAEIKRSSKVRYRINWKRFAVFILLVVLVLFLCIKGITGCVNRDKPDDGSVKKDNVADPSTVELKGDEPPTGEDTSIRGIPELKDVLTYDDGDLLVLVNKYHGVTRDYEPKDMVEVDLSMAAWDGIMIKKEAYDAFTELFRDAEAQGFTLAVCSGYRSYEYQQELFENAVSCRVEFFFAVHSVMERYGRMRERLALHQIGYISGFCLGLLEEFRAHRNVVKEIPYDYAGSVGSANLFQIQLNGLIPCKAAQRLIRGPDAGKGISGLRDHLYLRDGCDA